MNRISHVSIPLHVVFTSAGGRGSLQGIIIARTIGVFRLVFVICVLLPLFLPVRGTVPDIPFANTSGKQKYGKYLIVRTRTNALPCGRVEVRSIPLRVGILLNSGF